MIVLNSMTGSVTWYRKASRPLRELCDSVCGSTAISFRAGRSDQVRKEADVGMSTIKEVEHWSQRGRVRSR